MDMRVFIRHPTVLVNGRDLGKLGSRVAYSTIPLGIILIPKICRVPFEKIFFSSPQKQNFHFWFLDSENLILCV
jgi:hypothetical protein